MSRRGPMPGPLRVFVLGLFALVAFMSIVPVCVGYPLWQMQTEALLEEYAPTEEDRQLAREIQEAAEWSERDVHITPEQIAFARQMGELDELEAIADRRLEGRLEASRELTPAPRGRARGAFYRDREVVEEPAPSGVPWADLGLAVVAAMLLVGAIGAAAYATVVLTRSESEPPDQP